MFAEKVLELIREQYRCSEGILNPYNVRLSCLMIYFISFVHCVSAISPELIAVRHPISGCSQQSYALYSILSPQ